VEKARQQLSKEYFEEPPVFLLVTDRASVAVVFAVNVTPPEFATFRKQIREAIVGGFSPL
jgi:hypothetical protein